MAEINLEYVTQTLIQLHQEAIVHRSRLSATEGAIAAYENIRQRLLSGESVDDPASPVTEEPQVVNDKVSDQNDEVSDQQDAIPGGESQ